MRKLVLVLGLVGIAGNSLALTPPQPIPQQPSIALVVRGNPDRTIIEARYFTGLNDNIGALAGNFMEIYWHVKDCLPNNKCTGYFVTAPPNTSRIHFTAKPKHLYIISVSTDHAMIAHTLFQH